MKSSFIKKVSATALSLCLCAVVTACAAAPASNTQSSEPASGASSKGGTPSSQEVSSQEGASSQQGSGPAETVTGEIVTVTAYDGLTFDGKLRMPAGDKADKLVIYVNGSGPNTYDNKRLLEEISFNYHDLFAEKFTQEGTAYFSYNTRGVTMGEEPPYYNSIDEKAYQTYLPSNSVKDVESIINQLKTDSRLQDAKVILLGWSEGTMIAPQVALGGNAQVDALFLAGYCNETMADILDWQQTGGSSMVLVGAYLDGNGDGTVTREEYDADPYQVAAQLGAFEDMDASGDGKVDVEDFRLLLKENREKVFKAFDGGDDAWLKDNYGVRLTSAWFTDHRKLAPNSETMLKLDLPIYIFQGEIDANVPAQQARDIEAAFQAAGKTNLHLQEFGWHDHDLNYALYPLQGEISEGLQAIFDTAKTI